MSNAKEKKGKEKRENEKDLSNDIKKKSKSKRKKIIIISISILIIIVALIILFWDTSDGKDYPTVTKIINKSEDYIDEHIEFRGTVKKDSLDLVNKTFVLTDNKNDLRVNYTDLLPSNFEEGKDVVVKGTLRKKTELVVEAKEIIVGCASKY